MTKNKLLIMFTVLLLGTIGANTFLGEEDSSPKDSPLFASVNHFFGGRNTAGDNAPPDYTTDATEEGMQIYHHPIYGFSFSFPKDLNVSTFREGVDGEIVLAQGDADGKNFQIFINPFDEPFTIMTPERIQQDLSDFTIEDPKQVSLRGEIDALFFSDPTRRSAVRVK